MFGSLSANAPSLGKKEENGTFSPDTRGQRRYDITQLTPFNHNNATDRSTIVYAWVSSRDQKEDLQKQVNMLEMYCSSPKCGCQCLKRIWF